MELGNLFTSQTFSRYCTREVLQFLNPTDLLNVAQVNKFCSTACKDDIVVNEMVEKSMRSGKAACNAQIKIQTQCSNCSVLMNTEYVCFFIESGCFVYEKATWILKHQLKSVQILAKPKGNQQFDNSFRWVSTNLLLLRFSIKTVHKYTITTDSVRWILLDVVTGSQKAFYYKYNATIMDFGYDANSNTLTYLQRNNNKVDIVTINTETDASNISKWNASLISTQYSANGDYIANVNSSTLLVYQISSSRIIAQKQFTVPLPQIVDIVLSFPYIVILEKNSRYIVCYLWKVENDTLVLKTSFETSKKVYTAILGQSLYPCASPVPFYLVERTRGLVNIFEIKEVNFMCKKSTNQVHLFTIN